jgi:pimeloyl-ACP methyl ester carboxylesterase
MKLRVAGQTIYAYTNNREIEPTRESIVFIHGAGLDHTVWTMAARHFARHGRNVIAVDLPGHGRSGGKPIASITSLADWLITLLDALQVKRTALAGHSMGSLVALDCAARYPDRTRCLALVGSTAPMPVSEAILAAAAADDHAAFEMLTQWGYSKKHQYGGNPNPGMWMTGNTLRLFERSRPGVLFADMTACSEYQQGLERAGGVTCPVLVVLGKEDRLTPLRGSQSLLSALPHPRVEVVAGAGHTLMSEAPNALLDALRDIL